MYEYQKQTDAIHKIKLPSTINLAIWDRSVASSGDEVGLQVYTHFVGNESEIKVSIHNKSGKKLDEITGKVYGNRFKGTYTVSNKAKDAIYFEAELKKHKLKKKSEEMKIIPPITITNLKWSQQEAREGDILKLTADISGVPDGTEAKIEIYEYDDDNAHDFITRFSVLVDNSKVEAEWEYEYHEDTDDIPTAEETEKGYNPPEYFFRVSIGKVYGESGLLEFKDWIEIELIDGAGQPIGGEKYILYLPDGQKRQGNLDENGYARVEKIPPGKCTLEFPNLEG